jgi:pyridoxine 5-phosphate synthase
VTRKNYSAVAVGKPKPKPRAVPLKAVAPVRRISHLGVNIDHVATLRQLRGTPYPSLETAVDQSVKGGATQITVHLREDRRHIQDKDVIEIQKYLRKRFPKVPLNLEMALSAPIRQLALRIRPEWVCIVPEKRQELTTEGGLNLKKNRAVLKSFIRDARAKGIKVSLFVEPSVAAIKDSAVLGADAVELHTGRFCLAHQKGKAASMKKELKRIETAGRCARDLGLRVHAGHGIDHANLGPLVSLKDQYRRPLIIEYNVGHFLICRSLTLGLKAAVREMNQIVRGKKRAFRRVEA